MTTSPPSAFLSGVKDHWRGKISSSGPARIYSCFGVSSEISVPALMMSPALHLQSRRSASITSARLTLLERNSGGVGAITSSTPVSIRGWVVRGDAGGVAAAVTGCQEIPDGERLEGVEDFIFHLISRIKVDTWGVKWTPVQRGTTPNIIFQN